MRNLKKVIALVAVFAMLVSTVAFAGSYTDVADTDNYAEAIEMLSSLNILTGDKDANGNAVFRPNDSITRAEVATIVERIQNINNVAPTATQFVDVPASHWASGYIAQAAGQGIINGYGDGNFGPEDNVLYEQAVKMLVETLGYAPFVEANGGYYAGHLLAASRYGILDGVKGAAPGQQATRGQVAQLVYNAIDTPLMERVSFGTEAEYKVLDGGKDGKDEFVTLLTRDLGVVKGTGIVAKNALDENIDTDEEEEIKITSTASAKDDLCYEIADVEKGTLYANGTNAGSYKGLEVNYYAQEVKNGEYNIISIAPTSRNKVMTIALSDDVTFDGETFEYWVDDEEEEVDVVEGAQLSYNGISIEKIYADAKKPTKAELKTAYDTYAQAGFSGQITLVDNGTAKGYSIIALDVAVSLVVDAVEDTVVTFKEYATTADGKDIYELDFDEDDTDTLIKLTKDGAPFDYAQLKEWDVLSVLANNLKKEYYVASVIESGKVTGAVEEWDDNNTTKDKFDDSFKINGQWYEIVKGYNTDLIKTTSEGTFYVDAYGKIVAFDKTSAALGTSSDKYAYIVNTEAKEADFGKQNVMVQWLDKDGNFYNTFLASTVTLENIDAVKDLKTDLTGKGVTFEDVDGLYENAKIKINEVKDAKGEVDVARFGKIAAALKNKFVTYALSGEEIKTVTFATTKDDDEIAIMKKGAEDSATYSEEDKELVVGTTKYDIDDNTLVFFIGSEDGKVASGATATKNRSKVATAASLPTKTTANKYAKVTAYDVDDNDVPAVIVVYDEASLVSPNAAVAVIESVGTATVDGEEVKAVTYWMNGAKATAYTTDTDAYDEDKIAAGDIWKLIVDGTTITDAKFVADYSRDNRLEPGKKGAATITDNKVGETLHIGPVTAKKSNKVYYAAGNDFTKIDKFNADDAVVYVVDYNRKGDKIVVSAGSLADAKVNDRLVEMAEEGKYYVYDKEAEKTVVEKTEAALGMMDYVVGVEYDDNTQAIVIYKAAEFEDLQIKEVK